MYYTWPAKGNTQGSTSDLRRYQLGKRVMATTGAKLSLIMCPDDKNTKRVWLMEGDWDGKAIWECLRALKIEDRVYASPGAGVLPKRLFSLFDSKDVIVCYDHDLAGERGKERVATGLAGVASSIKFVQWPKEYPEGFDFRDLYHSYKRDAKHCLDLLKSFLVDSVVSQEDVTVDPMGDGVPASDVIKTFSKWLYMKYHEPIEVAFGAFLANRLSGDPLWLFIVAPPGGSKTEILMSVADAPLIFTTTSLTPHALISGANFGGRDPSLIPKLDGKVLVVKDFTTILSMNTIARDEIFGVLRDAYDGQIQKQFGNGIYRKYKSKFGIVAGVTPAIEGLQALNASLGERFLKYRIKHVGGRQAVRRALDNVSLGDEMRKELSEIGTKALDFKVSVTPNLPPEMRDKIVLLAEWVAKLRGVVTREKYTGQVVYKPMAEVGTRLAKQLCKLAFGISIFKREDNISTETYKTIASVAVDTIPDRVEDVVHKLFIHDGEGRTKEIASWSRLPEGTVRYLLQDLELLKIIRSEGHIWKLEDEVMTLIMELGLYERKVLKRKRS